MPPGGRYWAGIKQVTVSSASKFVHQDRTRCAARWQLIVHAVAVQQAYCDPAYVHFHSHRYTVRGRQMSDGWNHTGFPWNHWGAGQPSDPAGSPCVAADKAMRFWRYNATDNSTRLQDTSDATNNVCRGRHAVHPGLILLFGAAGVCVPAGFNGSCSPPAGVGLGRSPLQRAAAIHLHHVL
jgi:hypothetical protein